MISTHIMPVSFASSLVHIRKWLLVFTWLALLWCTCRNIKQKICGY